MISVDELWEKHASRISGVFERRPDFRFDPEHYALRIGHPELTTSQLAAHFQQTGGGAGLPTTVFLEYVVSSDEAQRILAELIIDPELTQLIKNGVPEALHLACELVRLGAPVDVEISDFSGDLYLRMHPDIARAKMDPLLHYLLYGAEEGRRILADLRKSQFRGRQPYRPDRPTCLICLHEMSRTGAPIVGRDLAREAALTHNVIVAALRDGPLLHELRETACEVLVTNVPVQDFDLYSGAALKKIDLAIINSVESWVFAPLLVARDIPFAAYIHEYADYTFPASKSVFSVVLTDLVVFSSEHVRRNWVGRLTDLCFDIDNDSIVIPQKAFVVGQADHDTVRAARANLTARLGRDLTGAKLICGAGHLQWRKGTDIFAMTAQICRHADPGVVFVWIGDGLNGEDMNFGAWMSYHLRQIGVNRPDGNLFLIPAGPAYRDVLAASDAMFVSSRLDPLPNVVFDALEYGCRIIGFENASGFTDPAYLASGAFITVEYANPAAAAAAIAELPRKAPAPARKGVIAADRNLFELIRAKLEDRLERQRYFVHGASQINVPIMFPDQPDHSPLRVREREKMLRYRRRLVWKDLEEVEQELAQSDNWIHRHIRLSPYCSADIGELPPFSLHVHAFYTDDLAEDLQSYALYRQAQRIVVTTDTPEKEAEIRKLLQAQSLEIEVVQVPNTGRDILPFLRLFSQDGAARNDEIWCHLHQKKSFSTTKAGDVWRRFLMRILLGDEADISIALQHMLNPNVGLVAPFDPYFLGWNESRRLLPHFADRLPGPLPPNPLLFPVGNMFWTRRSVVLAMNALFGPDYPWPNEPIANDGTEYHLIERLWPAMASQQGLESVFLYKLDQKRV